MMRVDTIDSPIGPLTTAERGDRICLLHFGEDGPEVDRAFDRWYPGEPRARQKGTVARRVLERYFAGDHAVLDTAAVELNGTPFQKNVWQALPRIPAGTTTSDPAP